jgi:deoxyribodipyrimidine photo-lyase
MMADKRNDPTLVVPAASNLSPYFHFGQLSVQRAVIYVKSQKKYHGSTDSFVVCRLMQCQICIVEFDEEMYSNILDAFDVM